jgi:hypothetical protein
LPIVKLLALRKVPRVGNGSLAKFGLLTVRVSLVGSVALIVNPELLETIVLLESKK